MALFDEISYWTELKLDIIREYAAAYSLIMAAPGQRSRGFSHVYIDAFAGAGVHLSKETTELVPGSPLIVLGVDPPFDEYFFIDIKKEKVRTLEHIAGEEQNVHLFHGDCNAILLGKVFPKVRYERYRRGLCLLDPYGLHLDWKVIQKAGEMGSIEIFLNFPVMDINRNVLWRNPDKVDPADVERMDRFWGDETWRDAAYAPTLFPEIVEKTETRAVAEAFRVRLSEAAGFGHVADPMPMRNTKGAVVYYLFFASPKPVAAHIVTQIFDKYRDWGR
jgi:three-Cys-motif partner protein